ncbi:MAG TPA: [protein-PII] uridylyltransferase, partial [Pirellulales bacterium]|nr:[protein-PII] uridylyltransferase [Pirellulales bacterium]
MPAASTLRPCVLAAKDWLAQERAKLKQQHEGGSPGIQVCARLTDMLDRVVLDLHQSALDELSLPEHSLLRSEVALVAHGGYGRRDVAPYSDVDLMILCSPKAAQQVEPLAKRLLHDLFDVGLILGQSVRTMSEACKLGLKDPTIFTSLAESRLLTGSQPLFESFQAKFQKAAKRHWRGLVRAIEESRRQERERFGETVYLLEPNVKRSPGGLRDIQLLRWVGFARYGEATPDGLQLMGELSKADETGLRRALELLLRVRNELHFHAEKEQDVLGRSEQVRMAKVFEANAAQGLLDVEVFMREYFRNTHAVQQVAARFLEGAQPWTKLGEALFPLLSRTVQGDFRIGPRTIIATRAGLQKLPGNLPQILRLVDLANTHNKRIAHSTWETVHRAVPQLPDVVTKESAELFLSVLSQPARLGELLRNLHALGVLERLIPAFAHARSLLQFNEYHKYTV